MSNIHLVITKLALTVVLIFSSMIGYGQTYYVGDKVEKDKEAVKYFTTKDIPSPYIEFKEKDFTLKVNRSDLINSLKGIISKLDSSTDDDIIRRYRIAVNYINSKERVNFDYLWTKWLQNESMSWDEAEQRGDYVLTRQVLREHICELIEIGRFQFTEQGKAQKQYYFKRVDSNYGGNVKGVFSKSDQLIWICYPFIIE